jgi:DNA-binding transcriptional LysR family regulator
MNIDQIDLRKLRAYQLVAQLGNLRAAAARLRQTVPAVSSKIRLLEAELGVQLFDRLPNRLRLTNAGEKFLPEVQAVVERMERALKVLADSSDLSGRISVSVGSDCSWYIAPRISRFLKRHPGVELDLQVLRGPEAINVCSHGGVDVAIGIFAHVPRTLDKRVLVETSLSLVCASGHPLLRRRPLRLADIARHKLILHPRHGATRMLVDKIMGQHSRHPAGVIEVANCQTANTFAQMDVGVAIVHSLCIAQVLDARTTAIGLEHLFGTVPFRAIFRRERSSGLVDALLQDLMAPIFK